MYFVEHGYRSGLFLMQRADPANGISIVGEFLECWLLASFRHPSSQFMVSKLIEILSSDV